MSLLHETTSLCGACKRAIPAKVVQRGHEVWMEKRCEACVPGDPKALQEVRLSTDAAWYVATRETRAIPHPPSETSKLEDGCPFDCGPCEAHTQDVKLPVVTITSACNLDCPICYVHNKNDDAYVMTMGEFDLVLGKLGRGGRELALLNLTGGEPLLHPEFMSLVERAASHGIHRVTACTNGIRLAKDEAFVEALASHGARVALSFDTFEDEADVVLQGATLSGTKLKALALCEKHGVDVTLIPVVTRGVNDHEIGKILELAFRSPAVRHVELHTITFTGQSGISFPRETRISLVEVLDLIASQTAGLLTRQDFVPSPAAHPLCYQIAYLLLDPEDPEGRAPIPFTRFLSRDVFYACLEDTLYLEPTAKLEAAFRGALDLAWAEGGPEAERIVRSIKALLSALFPRGRSLTREEQLRASERHVKAVYVHSHMDEETFDTERIAECCDSNCYADGRTIPVCAYNILYREKEPAFMTAPKAWGPKDGVRRLPVSR